MGYFGRTALGISKMKTQLQPHAAINERLSKSTWQYPVSVLYTAAYFAAQRSFTQCLDTFLVLFLDKFPGTWQIAANSTITLLAFTRPFIHSFSHSFTRSVEYSCTHSLIHLLIQAVIHLVLTDRCALCVCGVCGVCGMRHVACGTLCCILTKFSN